MKSLQFLTASLVAATLVLSGAGCKKAPKSVTQIPNLGVRAPGNNAGLSGPVTPNRTSVTPGIGQGRTISDGNPLTTGLGGDGGSSTVGKLPDIGAEGSPQGERPNLDDMAENRTALQAETVYFDFDRAEVRGSERTKVEAVAAYLRNNASAMLKVEGNCDERGTEEYNRSLGERRALSVREYLVTLGIDAARVSTVSFGEDRPAVEGTDESAYSKNRRADFVVLQAGAPATPGGIQ